MTARRPSPVRWRALAAAAAAAVALASVACSSGGAPSGAPSPAASTPASSAPTSNTAAPSPVPTTAPTEAPPELATPTPPPARVLYRGDPSRRVVALTFDAGSDAGHTAGILAELRAEGIRASFSVTGLWAEQHPDLLNAIGADGHLLINHTYDHASFTGLSTGGPPLTAAQRALELSRTETTVYHLAGRTTRPYFRPPYGDLDPGVQQDAANDGYGVIVMWTVDSRGWQGAPADAIVERCLAQAAPGAIFVMHVGSESADGDALPRVIAGLRAAGYGFVTVDELLQ